MNFKISGSQILYRKTDYFQAKDFESDDGLIQLKHVSALALSHGCLPKKEVAYNAAPITHLDQNDG